MTTINERTTSLITLAFTGTNAAPAAPVSLTYRIDCLTTGTAVRAPTNLSPAASVEITLSSSDSAIQNPANGIERRLVTISATYGAGDELHAEYEYNVRNLRFVAPPA